MSGSSDTSNQVPELMFPNPPIRLIGEHLDRFLLWAADNNASDISLRTDMQPKIHRYGSKLNAFQRPMASDEMTQIVNQIYGQIGSSQLQKGTDLDCAYEVRRDRLNRQRFRVSICGCLVNGQDGARLTMRPLPTQPPKLGALNLEQEILDNYRPHDGLVLVTGTTGSGKSTLLASMTQEMLHDPRRDVKIEEYSAPVEYTHDKLMSENPHLRSFINQTEVGTSKHIATFGFAVRNGMRNAPDVMLIGEARDADTMAGCVEAAQTGHSVYSTLHSGGVVETIRRMTSIFPAAERQDRAFSLAEQVRLVITQRLIKSTDGKRVAARGFLVFDRDVRSALLNEIDLARWPMLGRRLLEQHGQTMEQAVLRLHAEGRISDYEMTSIVSKKRAEAASVARAPTP